MVLSRSGEEIAAFTASIALSSPFALPIPTWAIPLSFITEETSAKSRLINPGTLIKSVIPCTDCCKTSSAFFKASGREVFFSTISNNLSFGMTIRVSTTSFNASIPERAFFIRCFASKRKGFVTTPTVRIPISFAIFAITGAAPVPVPPPIPQVTKTISAPWSAAVISSALSSAALVPISGFPPQPSPFVSFSPMGMEVEALLDCKACLSVFTPMNSTPAMPSSTIRFTALLPAPPTPMTIIFAAASDSGSWISIMSSSFKIYIPFHNGLSILINPNYLIIRILDYL